MSNILFIDIRNPDELFLKRLTSEHDYINMPMNTIRFNLHFIRILASQYKNIYLICQSGSRSLFIYNKYFRDNENFKNVNTDMNLQFKYLKKKENVITMKNNKTIKVYVKIPDAHNFYNITRVIQLFFGVIFLLICTLLILNKRLIASIISLVIGLMAIFNSLTNTCLLSFFLRDLLN